jgi:hypothetical protein
MLLSGLGSVRIVKNSDLGLENHRRHFQALTIRTSQPATNIYFPAKIAKLITLINIACYKWDHANAPFRNFGMYGFLNFVPK